jgi:hypothetical protein
MKRFMPIARNTVTDHFRAQPKIKKVDIDKAVVVPSRDPGPEELAENGEEKELSVTFRPHDPECMVHSVTDKEDLIIFLPWLLLYLWPWDIKDQRTNQKHPILFYSVFKKYGYIPKYICNNHYLLVLIILYSIPSIKCFLEKAV